MNYSKFFSLIVLFTIIGTLWSSIVFSPVTANTTNIREPLQAIDQDKLLNDIQIASHSIFNHEVRYDNLDTNKRDDTLLKQRTTDVHQTPGDTRLFWVPDVSSSSYEFYQVNATLEVIGPTCLIYSDLSISISTLTNLKDSFENVIYPILTKFYGSSPDIDLNGKIIILIYDIKDGGSGSQYISGFFYALNQIFNADLHPQNPQKGYSNEAEILFIDGVEGISYLNAGDFETVAHELQHMIHYANDDDEHLWLDEGASMFAEYLIGEDPFSSSTYKDPFQSNPSASLTYWNYHTYDESLINYGSSYAFFLYLAEHYGGSSFIQSLVKRLTNGINSIEQTLADFSYPADFREVFRNWTIANYLDDTSFASGFYGYYNASLSMFVEEYYSNSAIPRTENSVPYWGTDYLTFSILPESDFNLQFQGDIDAGFIVTAILSNTSSTPLVISVPISTTGFGNFSIEDLRLSADEITLVISSYTEGSTPNYNNEDPAPAQSYWFMINPSGVIISLGNLTFAGIGNPLQIWNVTVRDNTNFFWQEADCATYEIINSSDVSMNIFGNFTYNSANQYWESSEIDISSLPDGEYRIMYRFSNNTASGIGFSEIFIISNDSSNMSSSAPTTRSILQIPGFVILLAVLSLSILIGNKHKK
ncbi:MAG: hypothetical protein ACFFAU_03590 [Candidatus Hodarchaeota archaeon]